ncbi:hypothetical protein ES319_D11G004800v1 [Gossypium barbadense]|uniref:PPM-type phosphatase domain-containing protein n=1 Tax=Gossypium barbadense TaxID=3634 RepID=A0A5J5P988_GOSBA|nr:hypothetical protein ES319_D11G004800v1 [Gossypium barbadense]
MRTTSSNTQAEGSNSESNLKRQPEVDDDSSDSAAKKPKTQTPVQEESEKGEKSLDIEADVAEDKGSRHTMEDAWVIMLDATLDSPGKLRCGHFAIYDGHGGRLAAEYAQRHLHANVVSAGLPRELLDVKAAKRAILDGFRKTDEDLLKESSSGGWQDGATAVCVWVIEKMVFIANIGDAKAVVARSIDGSDKGSALKAIVLTREHKAIYPQERARIQKVKITWRDRAWYTILIIRRLLGGQTILE